MPLMQRLRRFVDWDFGTSYAVGGNATLFVAALPWMVVLAIREITGPRTTMLMVAVAALLTMAWLAFAFWRGWRLLKVSSIKAARRYDRKDKFKLPPEYANSESSMQASRAKKPD